MGLFDLVRAYSDLGDHRTGTPVDGATRRWFSQELAKRGARVAEVPFEFNRYDVTWTLAADGELIEAVPLYYEGLGTVSTDRPWTGQAFSLGAGGEDLVRACEEARASRRPAAVIATGVDHVVAVNRAPELRHGVPTLCVSGPSLSRVQAASVVRVAIEARILEGSSGNVLGLLGDASERPVIVTTPLSGWFRCAGERGTGIAVALEVAARLAQRHPVAVIGTSGHELEYLGVKRWLAAWPVQPRCVIHVGASVAACGIDRQLGSQRRAMTNVPSLADGFAGVLAPAALPVVANPAAWIGEGSVWADLGVPLLSVAGTFPWFHTPADLPDVSTSPALLERVHAAIVAAAELFARASAMD